MKPYLLTEVPKDIFNAGFKAKNDIRVALQAEVEDLTVPESFRWDKIPEGEPTVYSVSHLQFFQPAVYDPPV